MSTASALLITVLLLIGNAFFVGSEFAVMGARRSRIEPLVEHGKRGAQTAIYALENLTLMLATCQLGVTICSVALGAISEPAIAHLIEKPLEAVHVPHQFTHPIAFVLALLLVVFAHVVLGEMVPKNVAITTPEKAALLLMPVLVVFSKIFYPVVATLNWASVHFTRLFGIEPKDEVASAFTADEVASIVEASEAAGVLDADVDLLSGALEFSEHTARDVMVPLDTLESVTSTISVEAFEEIAGRTGFSRFAVLDSQGQPTGYLHLKDVLDVPSSLRSGAIPARRIRPLPTVEASAEVESALRTMQSAGTHMARVVRDGEAGSSAASVGVAAANSDGVCSSSASGGEALGVIFLEDILEELVGEVRDAMQRERRN